MGKSLETHKYVSILCPGGRMCNQLYLLYHAYNKFDIEKVYAPNFTHLQYFNIKLVDGDFYQRHLQEFQEIKWGDQKPVERSFYDSRFQDLKLKPQYDAQVQDLVKSFAGYDLVAVHMRHTDFKIWLGGKCYFTYEQYLSACHDQIKKWNLDKYKIIVFSDASQKSQKDIILASSLTNGAAPLDLFLMANCNYFICTYSTFGLLSIDLSKGLKKFKNLFLMEPHK